ncbi:hypothetical protein NDU88_002630 [Pleurodeles waltl]|uniref:Uncharacterized protein n=1 Tax=Pleurodeles waltl TaxID=8319 RepID=A0AAV7UDN0_PLEWA|nr:hypothetical protein NDU88_002630 [Pleurodeles waltl]
MAPTAPSGLRLPRTLLRQLTHPVIAASRPPLGPAVCLLRGRCRRCCRHRTSSGYHRGERGYPAGPLQMVAWVRRGAHFLARGILYFGGHWGFMVAPSPDAHRAASVNGVAEWMDPPELFESR